MAAKLYKVIKVQTGEAQPYGGGPPIKEMREIGVVIEHEAHGNKWLELKLHADVFQPVLFQQLKLHAMPKGGSMVNAKLYDPPRKLTDRTAAPEETASEEPPTEGTD